MGRVGPSMAIGTEGNHFRRVIRSVICQSISVMWFKVRRSVSPIEWRWFVAALTDSFGTAQDISGNRRRPDSIVPKLLFFRGRRFGFFHSQHPQLSEVCRMQIFLTQCQHARPTIANQISNLVGDVGIWGRNALRKRGQAPRAEPVPFFEYTPRGLETNRDVHREVGRSNGEAIHRVT